MTAQIISGTELSKKIKSDVASKIEHYRAQGKRAPGLAVILVGADPASQVYVGSKRKKNRNGENNFFQSVPSRFDFQNCHKDEKEF